MNGARHHDAIYPKPILAHISLFQQVVYEALSSVLDSFNAAKISRKSESTKFLREKLGNFLFFKKLFLPLHPLTPGGIIPQRVHLLIFSCTLRENRVYFVLRLDLSTALFVRIVRIFILFYKISSKFFVF